MNYRGSYRKLVGNAKAAMMAAIEIYNKPAFSYREECVVILLLNAWELLLKAVLSKKGESIFYRKKRGEPYRTLSWQHALGNGETFFPKSIPVLPVRKNLELLGTYRDNAVHFYNAKGFAVLLYALAQTNIKNFRDLLEELFGIKLEHDINWQLLPLGIQPPIDPIAYIAGVGKPGTGAPNAVRQFVSELAAATDEVRAAGEDTGRLLTVFNVKLQSVKKIGDADAVVGVEKAAGATGPLAVVRRQDPNVTHPLRQKEVVEKIGSLHGKKFTSYVFQAVVWKLDLKADPRYCWQASEGVLTRYSSDVIARIKQLTKADLKAALTDYREHLRKKRVKGTRK